MQDALAAAGPDSALAGKLATFGQFVGSWRVLVTTTGPDGTPSELEGEWTFGWALGGRAVVDVWDVPGRELGMAVRFYDPAIDAWRVSWSGPTHGRQISFVARQVGDEIVLEGEEDGKLVRWTFFEVESNAFRWRAEESTDGGERWDQVQEMRVTRH